MRPAKRDISLNERDSLRDLLAAEEALLQGYGAAIASAEGAAMQKQLFSLFRELVTLRGGLREHMRARGYAQAKYASPEERKALFETGEKAQKQLAPKKQS